MLNRCVTWNSSKQCTGQEDENEQALKGELMVTLNAKNYISYKQIQNSQEGRM
jgi:hypothetical protein